MVNALDFDIVAIVPRLFFNKDGFGIKDTPHTHQITEQSISLFDILVRCMERVV